jgi:hypothetical protein
MKPVPKALLIIAAYKAIMIFCALAAIRWGQFNVAQWGQVLHWPPDSKPSAISRFGTWDSAHYLYLASAGYKAESPSCAFYPALPGMLSLLRQSPRGMVIWGLLLCNLIGILGLLIAFVVFRHMLGNDDLSIRALILLICYPGSMFLNLIYTEPIFLFQSSLFIWACMRGKIVLIGISALTMPLTKAIGFYGVVFLSGAMALHRYPWKSIAVAVTAVTTGYLSYFILMLAMTGNCFEGFAAQRHFPTSPSIANAFDLPKLFNAWFVKLSFHGITDSFLDRFFFMMFLLTLAFELRTKAPWAWFAVPVGLIPALSALWISHVRALVSCWILTPRIALWTASGKVAFVLIAATSFSLQIWLFIRHLNFYWAN